MKQVRITVAKVACYPDLIRQYENPITHACSMKEGMTFLSSDGEIPDGFCTSAWKNLSEYVFALASGGENFYDGWMQNPKSAMISCNDGFRPVSFLLETIS